MQWEKGGILCRAEVRWYTSDSVRKVALIRPGLSRATFPQGKALGGTVYHRKMQHFNLYSVARAFPEGEGGRKADG